MQTFELLNVTTDIGYCMLEQGAEIYRVEESMRRILQAYGHDEAETYAIPGSIIVTILDETRQPLTKTRRILKHETNLDKVDKLNNLCRHVCKSKPTYKQISFQLKSIMSRTTYSPLVQVLAYAIIGFSFAIFFQGSLFDAIVASVIALIIKLMQFALQKLGSNEFFMILLCSSFTAFTAIFTVRFGIADNMDKVIIGSLMTLVPGITLTNCMRDFIAGDFMAGLSRMVEALLIATGIAIGVAINLTLLRNYIQ